MEFKEYSNANNVHCTIYKSDKAVNPTNVMGTSKLMGEKLITAANALRKSNDRHSRSKVWI